MGTLVAIAKGNSWKVGISPWIGARTGISQDFLRSMRDINTAPESIETFACVLQTKPKDIFAIDLPVDLPAGTRQNQMALHAKH